MVLDGSCHELQIAWHLLFSLLTRKQNRVDFAILCRTVFKYFVHEKDLAVI